jgi:dUTPase
MNTSKAAIGATTLPAGRHNEHPDGEQESDEEGSAIIRMASTRQHRTKPARQWAGSMNFDLKSATTLTIPPGQTRNVSTGVALRAPEGVVLRLALWSVNAGRDCEISTPPDMDTIEQRVETQVPLANNGTTPLIIPFRARVAMITPIVEALRHVKIEQVELDHL